LRPHWEDFDDDDLLVVDVHPLSTSFWKEEKKKKKKRKLGR
jgi:hypothetical protein